MVEKTTRMESHYEVIMEMLKFNKKEITRILYPREIRMLRKRFKEIENEVQEVYKEPLYKCVIKNLNS